MAADQWFSQGPGISSIRCNKSVNPFQRSSLGTLHKERFTVQMDGTQHFLHKEKGRNWFASQTKSKTRPNLNKEITWGNAMKSPQVIPALSGPGLCTDSSVAQFSPCTTGAQSEMQNGTVLTATFSRLKKGWQVRISQDIRRLQKCLKSRPHPTKLPGLFSPNIFTENSEGKSRQDIRKMKPYETPLAVQWLRLCLPMQGVQTGSLARALRSNMPPMAKKPKHKQKQYCNKFNKDFKNGPH